MDCLAEMESRGAATVTVDNEAEGWVALRERSPPR